MAIEKALKSWSHQERSENWFKRVWEITSELRYPSPLQVSVCILVDFVRLKQGWRSREITRLSPMWPMWPRFDSQTRHHMWVEFCCWFLSCSKRFFSMQVFQFSPLLTKTNISKLQFDLCGGPLVCELLLLCLCIPSTLTKVDLSFFFYFYSPVIVCL